MYNLLNYVSYVIILLIIPQIILSCDVDHHKLEVCVEESVFIGNPNAIVPANDAEMEQHCSMVKGGIKCAGDYADTCLNGLAQSVTRIIVKNFDSHMHKRCNQPKDRADFIDNVKCFLPKEKMKPLYVCYDKYIKSMDIAVHMPKTDAFMPLVCCGFHLFKQCVLTETKKICSDAHAEYWDDVYDEISAEAITYACNQFETVDECSKNLDPKYWTQLSTIDKATDPAVWDHGRTTFIKYVLDLIQSFHMDSS
ncbi:uncharacterized protein LOC128958235 [Oppia nitens]|uniref:uncharacterized protein LOC128958235 n=1 Tax=Oppia nitens TaxID=1686743 RepID=UPI0023DB007C|nr:uncharacterized protein LOC128958235 [Oppia nitens]